MMVISNPKIFSIIILKLEYLINRIIIIIICLGKPVDEVGKPHVDDKKPKISGNIRTIRVFLDPNQYKV